MFCSDDILSDAVSSDVVWVLFCLDDILRQMTSDDTLNIILLK